MNGPRSVVLVPLYSTITNGNPRCQDQRRLQKSLSMRCSSKTMSMNPSGNLQHEASHKKSRKVLGSRQPHQSSPLLGQRLCRLAATWRALGRRLGVDRHGSIKVASRVPSVMSIQRPFREECRPFTVKTSLELEKSMFMHIFGM